MLIILKSIELETLGAIVIIVKWHKLGISITIHIFGLYNFFLLIFKSFAMYLYITNSFNFDVMKNKFIIYLEVKK